MTDFPMNGYRVRDEHKYERSGEASLRKVVTFYLGPHGPFTETFSQEEFSASAVNARADRLRAELRMMR